MSFILKPIIAFFKFWKRCEIEKLEEEIAGLKARISCFEEPRHQRTDSSVYKDYMDIKTALAKAEYRLSLVQKWGTVPPEK